MTLRGVWALAGVLAAFGGACTREPATDAPAPSAASAGAGAALMRLGFDVCRGCRCCRAEEPLDPNAVGLRACSECVVESTFDAYGISYVGPGRFQVRHPMAVRDGPPPAIKLTLVARASERTASVKLALPRETVVFGVTVGFVSGGGPGCVLTLASPSQRISVDAKEGARPLMTSPAKGHLEWVELTLTCPSSIPPVVLDDLWLSPSITPRFRPETASSEPNLVPIAELPAPRKEGKQLLWEPPVPLEHGLLKKAEDVATAVARSPAVVEALALRQGLDEFVFESSPPWELKFGQRYRFRDTALKVEDGALSVFLEDGFKLRSITVDTFRPGIEMPKRAPMSPQQATRIIERHARPILSKPVLAFFGSKLVYAFDLICHRGYVGALDGAYTEGPDNCRRGAD